MKTKRIFALILTIAMALSGGLRNEGDYPL